MLDHDLYIIHNSRTFGVRCVGQRWLIGDVLAAAQQIVLHDWSFVLQLSPEATMVVLRRRNVNRETKITRQGASVSGAVPGFPLTNQLFVAKEALKNQLCLH